MSMTHDNGQRFSSHRHALFLFFFKKKKLMLFSSSAIFINTEDGTCISELFTCSRPILYMCHGMLGGTSAGSFVNCIPVEWDEWYSTGLL